ncbi:MAG: hypothetical protein R3F43_06150 [bacterium]
MRALASLLFLGATACGAGPSLSPAKSEAQCAEVLAGRPADDARRRASPRGRRPRVDAGAIRWIYVCRAYGIAAANRGWIAAGQPAEARARQASDVRRTAKATARAMMDDQALAAELRARDQAKYGDPEGPTFEWLVKKARGRGLEGDAIYTDIIRSAGHTNDEVNASLGIPRLQEAEE